MVMKAEHPYAEGAEVAQKLRRSRRKISKEIQEVFSWILLRLLRNLCVFCVRSPVFL
jgi:hypothetical protein